MFLIKLFFTAVINTFVFTAVAFESGVRALINELDSDAIPKVEAAVAANDAAIKAKADAKSAGKGKGKGKPAAANA